ncbi:unnamed protein product [Protopolystoma xenopodis]|uniref:Uncharacterized protein n=1 Tax=Protopolystoma xenopodis TaxID=117903 RepID=A0A3S5BZI0_9PLAT|nr:unnamed protein product [Protopolystoma xenopodis]
MVCKEIFFTTRHHRTPLAWLPVHGLLQVGGPVGSSSYPSPYHVPPTAHSLIPTLSLLLSVCTSVCHSENCPALAFCKNMHVSSAGFLS